MGTNGLAEEDIRHRLAVFAQCRTDGEAAKRLGIHQTTFTHWRIAQGIPAKNPQPESRTDDDAFMAAYRETESDGQAAKRLGVKSGSFNAWRRRNGLPAKQKSFAQLLSDKDRRARMDAYYASTSMAEFAKRTGLGRSSAATWLKNHRLLSPDTVGHVVQAQQRFAGDRALYRVAYDETDTDLEGASMMGVHLKEFRQWRIWEGLPPKTSLA